MVASSIGCNLMDGYGNMGSFVPMIENNRVYDERWMVSGQETIFCWVPVS
jgi:hypothetical protein